MKIVGIARTLNEEHNIANFCTGYDWCDMILVADGGSSDETVEIAERFPDVYVREFAGRIDVPDDLSDFMNPQPQHLNFLIDWANIEEEADWIVLDDVDCWPNPAMKANARFILEGTSQPAVHLYRLYMWGADQYFPKYNVDQSLWAWQPDMIDIRCDEEGETFADAMISGIDPSQALLLDPPYVCLHHFAPDEDALQRKMARYASWGRPQVHPLESIYAPPEPLPEWVYAP